MTEVKIEITSKMITIFFMNFFFYLYLCDEFARDTFAKDVQSVIWNFGNSTSHSFIYMTENYKHCTAALVSLSIMLVGANIPVLIKF